MVQCSEECQAKDWLYGKHSEKCPILAAAVSSNNNNAPQTKYAPSNNAPTIAPTAANETGVTAIALCTPQTMTSSKNVQPTLMEYTITPTIDINNILSVSHSHLQLQQQQQYLLAATTTAAIPTAPAAEKQAMILKEAITTESNLAEGGAILISDLYPDSAFRDIDDDDEEEENCSDDGRGESDSHGNGSSNIHDDLWAKGHDEERDGMLSMNRGINFVTSESSRHESTSLVSITVNSAKTINEESSDGFKTTTNDTSNISRAIALPLSSTSQYQTLKDYADFDHENLLINGLLKKSVDRLVHLAVRKALNKAHEQFENQKQIEMNNLRKALEQRHYQDDREI